jgi:hypothetical protein
VRWPPNWYCVIGTMTQPRSSPPRLIAAAQAYVGAGWPVASGAWWDPAQERYLCTLGGCAIEGPHPTLAEAAGSTTTRCQVSVAHASTQDLGIVAARWGRWPYAVLLPTGYVADVVELRGSAAVRVRAVLAEYDVLGPVAIVPDGRTLLFTATAGPLGKGLVAELTAAGAVCHVRGSWVPLPPSRLAAGPVEWMEPPGAIHWSLPPLETVADALRLG